MALDIDLASLQEADRSIKPTDGDNEWIRLHAYYDDTSRALTRARLDQLGCGLKDNHSPLEVSLLRRIIDRLAVVYDRPPTRWLRTHSGIRLAESSSKHRTMVEVLERAQYDLIWRRVDKLRALLRQVVLRVYPSDALGSCVIRIFEPYNVIRDPDPCCPDRMDEDRRFALRLQSSGESEAWEYWERDGDLWSCVVVDESGTPMDDQPFASTDLVCPYPVLPVQMVYDDLAAGHAWLAPRCSRSSWVDAVNAISNDLWALVLNQAHDRMWAQTDNPEGVPESSGPGTMSVVPRDTTLGVISGNPKIDECQRVLDSLVRLWSISEDLPSVEFDRSKQVVTGAALRVQERPLSARREALVPLAQQDERLAYARIRGVHNTHTLGKTSRPTWTLPPLDLETSLDVEVADLEQPADTREMQEAMARSIALGSKSVIDLIMREDGVPRHVAIQTYARVQADNAAFPPRSDAASMQEGPKLTAIRQELDGKPSVIEAVRDGNEG